MSDANLSDEDLGDDLLDQPDDPRAVAVQVEESRQRARLVYHLTPSEVELLYPVEFP